MSSLRDSVQFLKPDNEDEELLAGYQNLTYAPTSVDFSNKNNCRNNIVYCVEKYQITILATEIGIENIELPQISTLLVLLLLPR